MVRTGNGREPDVISFGPFSVDRSGGVLSKGGSDVPLSPKAMGVLLCFLNHPGMLISKEDLLDEVWNGIAVTDASLTEAVRTLRQALGDDPKKPTCIQTVHRRGYRFIATVNENREQPRGAADVGTVASTGEARRHPPVSLGQRSIAALALIVASLLVGAVGTWLVTGAGDEVAAGGLAFLDITLPGEAPMRISSNVPNLAISPDGQSVVYEGPARALYLRHIDTPGGVRIIEGSAGSQTFRGATITPDGRQVAFFRFEEATNQSKPVSVNAFGLRRVPLEGGQPIDLVGGHGVPLGLAWGPDGTLVYGTTDDPGLWVLPPGRGASPSLIAGEHGLFYKWPHVLPDGKTVIATARSCVPTPLCPVGGAEDQIVAISLDSGQQRVLLDGGGRAKFVSSGHLVIGRDQQLLAAPFDPDAVALYGRLQVVQDNVMSTGVGSDAVYFDVSPTGNLVYASSEEFPRLPPKVVLVSRSGDTEPLPMLLRNPHISPDGTALVGVGRGDLPPDLYVHTLGRGASLTRLTLGLKIRKPIWTPRGHRLIFAVLRDGHHDLFSMPANNSAPPTLLRDTAYDLAPESWSPDGRLLAFTETTPETIEDIWLMSPDGAAWPFLRTPFIESNAAFSPDGRWIAYHSNQSGTYEIYVRPVPEDPGNHDPSMAGYRKQVSTDCGGWPVWAPDGSELYFRGCETGTGSFWAVPIETNGIEVEVGEPELLFDGQWERGERRGPSYSVTPDGRFLLAQRATANSVNGLKVVLNWFEELKRLVPTGR